MVSVGRIRDVVFVFGVLVFVFSGYFVCVGLNKVRRRSSFVLILFIFLVVFLSVWV